MAAVSARTRIVGDFHTHTLASVHAYSTLRENMNAAQARGLKFLAVTEHAMGLDDSPSPNYFINMRVWPREVCGVRLLRGVEANIVDHGGGLDMPERLLARLDFVIASYHASALKPGDEAAHTAAYLALARNPRVHLIGHSGTPAFAYDYERLIPEFGARGKVVEINAASALCRPGSEENCRRIARLCARHAVPVMVNSDAHIDHSVGRVEAALELLAAVDFPEELVINCDEERTRRYLQQIGALR